MATSAKPSLAWLTVRVAGAVLVAVVALELVGWTDVSQRCGWLDYQAEVAIRCSGSWDGSTAALAERARDFVTHPQNVTGVSNALGDMRPLLSGSEVSQFASKLTVGEVADADDGAWIVFRYRGALQQGPAVTCELARQFAATCQPALLRDTEARLSQLHSQAELARGQALRLGSTADDLSRRIAERQQQARETRLTFASLQRSQIASEAVLAKALQQRQSQTRELSHLLVEQSHLLAELNLAQRHWQQAAHELAATSQRVTELNHMEFVAVRGPAASPVEIAASLLLLFTAGVLLLPLPKLPASRTADEPLLVRERTPLFGEPAGTHVTFLLPATMKLAT